MKDSSRRIFLRGLGSFGALALLHCAGVSGSSGDSNGDAGGSGSDPDGSDDPGSTGISDGGTTSDDASIGGDSTVDAAALATGSGAFLTGKDYGNPFVNGAGTTCTTFKDATKGPCHSNTYDRKDVSDGLVGLPTRFEFLVVDASCNPIADAIVEVWYASPAGTYSKAAEAIDSGSDYKGSLSDLDVGFCTGNDSVAVASNWLRGFQKSDANGRVTIDGIFPGWYSSRAPHVHFIVTANGHTSVTSQLAFDETLTTAIYTKHGSYASRGDKDTSNAKDGVFGSGGGGGGGPGGGGPGGGGGSGSGLTAEAALMSFAQQSDGALVCWKAITVA